MTAKRVLIFANGELPDLDAARSLLQPGDVVICADGGSRYALALGLHPDRIVGDLDSMTAEHRAMIIASGAPIQQHSHDKNETDLELAVQYALSLAPSSIVIVGALGRRLDHTIGNIAMLTSTRLAQLDVRLDDGLEEALFCREQSQIHGAPGHLVSLIPWGAAVEGVRTDGLKWALRGETLYPEKTRGISNEMLSDTARVTILAGLLLVVHRRVVAAEDAAEGSEKQS